MSSYIETSLGKLPVDWSVVALSELTNKSDKHSFKGGPFGSDLKSSHYTQTGVRIVQLQDIGEGEYLDKSNVYTSEEKADELKACNVYPGEIIFSKMMPVANACILPDTEDRYLMCSDGIRFSVDLKKHENKYVFYAVNAPEFRKRAEEKSTGSTRQRIGLPELRGLEIALPPIQEQKKIAKILTAVDKKIENIGLKLSSTRQLKKGLMQKLFSVGAGVPVEDCSSKKNGKITWKSHTEFENSKLGRIPKGWSFVEIQELGTVIRGASPRPKGDPRYYGGTVPRLMGSDVTKAGKWVTPSKDFLTEEGAKLSRFCKKGTLTVICSGEVGIPSFLAVDACIHDGFLAIIDIDKEKVNEDYLYYIIQSLKQKLDSSATHGGVFTNLTTSILREFILPLPTLVEQERIAELLSVVDDKLVHVHSEKLKIIEMKKGLMQKLLTGQWRVKIDKEDQVS